MTAGSPSHVALVTGAASGIGRATALRLSRDGMAIVAVDIDEGGLDMLADSIGSSGGAVCPCRCDITLEHDVEAAFQAGARACGAIDVVANVAGVTMRPKTSLENVSIEQLERIMAINFYGSFLTMKHAVPSMKANGYGRIVNVSSVASFSAVNAGNSPYGASKGAVNSLTRQAVADLSSFGITVNAVAPGITRTPITDRYDPALMERVVRAIPVSRIGEPEDIAAAIAFLASPDAGFITGQTLVVDGGMTSVVHLGDR